MFGNICLNWIHSNGQLRLVVRGQHPGHETHYPQQTLPTTDSHRTTSPQWSQNGNGVKRTPFLWFGQTGPQFYEAGKACLLECEDFSHIITSKLQATELRSALLPCTNISRTELLQHRLGMVRWLLHPEEGEFVDGDCTFLHSGRPNDQPKLKGVAMALKNTFRPSAVSWKCRNSRTMSLCIKLHNNYFAAIIRR